MIIVLPRSASPDSKHGPREDISPDTAIDHWDQPHGLRVRQAGTIAVIDAESHTALRGWLITQPLYAAFAWELDGYSPSSTLQTAPGQYSTSD